MMMPQSAIMFTLIGNWTEVCKLREYSNHIRNGIIEDVVAGNISLPEFEVLIAGMEHLAIRDDR